MPYNRELVKQMFNDIIDNLPEYKLEAFITLFGDENVLARMECEDMIAHPEKYKWYKNAKELWEDIEL